MSNDIYEICLCYFSSQYLHWSQTGPQEKQGEETDNQKCKRPKLSPTAGRYCRGQTQSTGEHYEIVVPECRLSRERCDQYTMYYYKTSRCLSSMLPPYSSPPPSVTLTTRTGKHTDRITHTNTVPKIVFSKSSFIILFCLFVFNYLFFEDLIPIFLYFIKRCRHVNVKSDSQYCSQFFQIFPVYITE